MTSLPDSRRRLWLGLKWLLFAAVLAFVGRRAYGLWHAEQGALAGVRIEPLWLLLSAVAYAVGWLPSVWFWRELMRRLGGAVIFRDAARAYYCGHLGKYVPGKAVVLVIRAGLVKGRGAGAAAAAVTATFETLLMMGAGLAIAVALAPLLLSAAMIEEWPNRLRQILLQPGAAALLTALALIASLPLLARLLTYVAVRMTPREMSAEAGAVRIGPRLVAAGLAAFAVGWAFHGLSLGLTLRAVSGEALHLGDWPLWTGAVAAATSLGFAVLFAPGGVGVREGILIEILRVQPGIGPQQAVVAAVLLRAVWFVTEVVAAGALYYAAAPREPFVEQ